MNAIYLYEISASVFHSFSSLLVGVSVSVCVNLSFIRSLNTSSV